MNLSELTDLLVSSSQNSNRTQYIPWWEDDPDDNCCDYDILPENTAQEARACIGECGKDALLAPVGRYGLTLFHLFIWHNFYDSVSSMLCDGRVSGADVNLPDHKGYGLTPFLLACLRGNLAMAKLLLEHGADSSVCDKRGMNAYHFLAYPRFEGLSHDFGCLDKSVEQRGEIARLLTCDINQKDENGFTPLARLLASEQSASYTWPLTGIFLEKGAETDYVDENGNTLLMMALRNRHQTAALALMKHCPEMTQTANHNGVTPVQHAVSFMNTPMYLALTDHGAPPAEPGAIQMFPLSQITSNAFCGIHRDDKDGMAIALYLANKLLQQMDLDDDDDLGEITEILHNALISDKDAHVLDSCHAAGFPFTMPLRYQGSTICLRDECLKPYFGSGVIKKLVSLGVDMDKAVISGKTPANLIADKQNKGHTPDPYFEEAAAFFSRESMEQLDKYGVAAVHLAAREGHTGMLKIMIEKGVDINLTEDAPAQAGTTPLHEACAAGHADAVKLLIAAGADDTMKNSDGETPAHAALTKDRYSRSWDAEQRIRILKELKNLDIPRNDGQTPLLMLRHDTSELLPVFLERGVDINHTDNNGMTAMMLNTSKDMAKLLIRAGADITLADNEGNTALHYALEEYDQDMARFLIKKGADYNRPNNEGVTPVQMAVEKDFEMVLDLMTDIE